MNLQRRLVVAIIFVIFYSLNLFAQSSLESKFISRVSQKRLQQNVRELVKCGNRSGGTKSGDKSAHLVAEKFKSCGFKPEIVIDPDKLAYSFDNWQLKIEEPKRLRGLIQHEWLANYSPSVLLDTTQLIFVESINDIDEDKIKNNAVLLEQPPSDKMYDEMVDAGARCILSFEAKNEAAYSNWAMISDLKVSNENKIPVFNISNNAGNRLKIELARGTKILLKYSSKTNIKIGNPKTVMVTLKGESEDYYIVCAHGDSDSGGPGADDNASGVSGVLEVGRILNALVKKRALPLPRFSIKFIVWGCEYFSASNYVKQHADELDKIRGVINFDEIGIGKTRDCLYFEGNNALQNCDLLRVLERVGEDYVDRKGFWKESTTNPLQGGTDSYVFLPKYLDHLDLPKVQIPSITIFTAAWNEPKLMSQTPGWTSKAWKGHPDSVSIDYSPYYHSSLDIPAFTTDKEPANMVWAVNAVGIALIRLLWQYK